MAVMKDVEMKISPSKGTQVEAADLPDSEEQPYSHDPNVEDS